MSTSLRLHPDRLFPAEPGIRAIARELYSAIAKLPIISPHGHTDPAWFAYDKPFSNATDLLLTPDHYLFRMLYSQGINLESLGVRAEGEATSADPRAAWRLLAENIHLFRGTPSAVWLNHVFVEVFGLDVAFDARTADLYFDHINAALATPAFRPRALFERFNIELLATTESPSDDLVHHRAIRDSGWTGRVVTAYRPDPVVNVEDDRFPDGHAELRRIVGSGRLQLGRLSGSSSHPARGVPGNGRDLHRSWSYDRLYGRSECAGRRGSVQAGDRRAGDGEGRGAVPGADADRNGQDER